MSGARDILNAEYQAAVDGVGPRCLLRLYISGMTPRSTEAIATLRELCDGPLGGRCELRIIDLYEHPELATEDGVRAVPTVVRKLPAPVRRIVGDLADPERIIRGLELMDTPDAVPPADGTPRGGLR